MSDRMVKTAAPCGGVPAGLRPPSEWAPAPSPGANGGITTDVPARLDRLPWGSFHWLLITALGITWVLDGLEATIVAAIGSTLEKPTTLGLRAGEIGLAGTLYLAGAIGGALLFGHLTDRLGRKKLFTVTLGIYLAGAALTACSWNYWSFVLFRVVTGMAIGGEYSAINSAIDELIPARIRGRVDLAINGTYWLGAMAGWRSACRCSTRTSSPNGWAGASLSAWGRWWAGR
jgi:MFS family permease